MKVGRIARDINARHLDNNRAIEVIYHNVAQRQLPQLSGFRECLDISCMDQPISSTKFAIPTELLVLLGIVSVENG